MLNLIPASNATTEKRAGGGACGLADAAHVSRNVVDRGRTGCAKVVHAAILARRERLDAIGASEQDQVGPPARKQANGHDAGERVDAVFHRLLELVGRLVDFLLVGALLFQPLQFLARIAENVRRMRWLASEILERARGDHPDIDDHGLAAQLDALATTAPSLPPAWYADAAELAA